MKNQKFKISIKLTCQHCGNSTKQNSTLLSKQIQYLKEHKLPWYAWNGWIDEALKSKGVKSELGSFLNYARNQPNLLELLNQGHFQWACDHCIETKNAIEGNIDEQTFCDNPPYLVYIDEFKICQTCSAEYKFSKEEQKYWYEELKFWVQSTPKNCKDCRKILREKRNINTKLSNLIKELDKENSNQLIEVSQLYFEMGLIEKGKQYATLANKVSRKKNKHNNI